ncbi:restriction endonuclease subunit S [Flavobacterium xinjiangense]|uniref:Type I restriction enzyme, S subunit n=1 Tax=Flavobacterium xinjiangense TaxID=178356 RepID=A0A1M7MIM2_9FLAO|nr:restriction endonuclease subunit S [Flavobacterium xinjiangense]SHM90276.1 type I restriction enzyme, S subunit [Flavobacterium xinjiangense]
MEKVKNTPTLRFPEFKDKWKEHKLKNLVRTIDSGWSPQCEEYPSNIDEWGVLKTTSVVWEGFNENENKRLPDKLEPRFNIEVKPNDILITRAGPTSRVGVTVHVDKVRSKLMLSDKIIRLRTCENNSSKFIAISLSNSKAQKELNSKSSGLAVSQTNISQNILLNIAFNCPSFPEQTKIATFLSAVDEKLQALKQKKSLLEQYKKGVMQKIFSQELRFKDDNGNAFADWEEKKLGECLDYLQPTKYLVSSTEYDNSFATPVLTAGKTFILGYTNETNGIFENNLPVIIFDDFTTATQFVDFPFKAKSSAMKILVACEGIDIKFIYEAMQIMNYEIGGHERHWISKFAPIDILIPCLEEQTKIATFLSTIDEKINHCQAQITNTEVWKRGLLQGMFV